jgi:alpha-L-fucosidase 2
VQTEFANHLKVLYSKGMVLSVQVKGGTASHEGYIEILPALPDDWKDGSFAGLCVRGGGVISAKWSNAKPNEIVITATADHRFKIKRPVGSKTVKVEKNKKIIPQQDKKFLLVSMKKGESVKILFD